MNASPCVPCCGEPVVTEIPGAAGLEGPTGPQGEQGEPGEPGETPTLNSYTDYNAPAYTVTATPTQVTGAQVTLGLAGRYQILARAQFNAAAATFAASRDVTTYLYDATDASIIGDSTVVTKTPVITTQTQTLAGYNISLIYEAPDDSALIQLWTSVGTIPSAGTLDCVDADLVAIRLGD